MVTRRSSLLTYPAADKNNRTLRATRGVKRVRHDAAARHHATIGAAVASWRCTRLHCSRAANGHRSVTSHSVAAACNGTWTLGSAAGLGDGPLDRKWAVDERRKDPSREAATNSVGSWHHVTQL